jgi:L-ascorbate metabolism protein UlaG (beta-lactamase superfamily)
MFKITHYANSFIVINSNNSSIACDPWIGKTTDNGWFSYPLKNKKDVDRKVFNSNFIYVSHLHCDHIDPKTLKEFKNENLTFIIKKFNNAVLKKRLQRFFPKKKIIEIEAFKKKKINKDFTIVIIPQIISNSSNLPDHIQYDMDTSILVQSNKTKEVFYNNVDMPINLKILKKINDFAKKNLKRKINIFCLPLGAACEFPQCFLNINRKEEQKKLVKESLKNLKKLLKYLKPQVFFPAGGTYAIYGKFHKLNKYIAQPSFEQIKSATSNLNTKVYNIIGGGSINYDNSKYSAVETRINIANNFDKKFINHIKNLDYYYAKKNINADLEKLDVIFDRAKLNYFRILAMKKNINTKWDIYFNIYKNYEINKRCFIDKKKSKL